MTMNFASPATTDNYATAFVPNIQANQTALAQMLDSTNVIITGTPPTYAKRYNRTTTYLEEYSGSTWATLAVRVGNSDQLGGQLPAYYQVALGYTPYNSTNPSNYISGITSANVTTALGYTPVNAAAATTFSVTISVPSATAAAHAVNYGQAEARYATIAGLAASIAAPQAYIASSMNGGQLAGLRNRVINGNFNINQRAVSGTVTLAAGAYGHDRFRGGASGCTYTFTTSLNGNILTITAGSLQQVIEGSNLEGGSFKLSWNGTATGRVDSGSYGASGVIGTATAGTNQTVEFGTGTLGRVQYELGATVTPFEQRPIGLELGLCQRYAQVICGNPTGSGTAYSIAGIINTSTTMLFAAPLACAMRAAFSLSQMSALSTYGIATGPAGTAYTLTSIVLNTSSLNNIAFLVTTTVSGFGVGAVIFFTCTSSGLLLSAEL